MMSSVNDVNNNGNPMAGLPLGQHEQDTVEIDGPYDPGLGPSSKKLKLFDNSSTGDAGMGVNESIIDTSHHDMGETAGMNSPAVAEDGTEQEHPQSQAPKIRSDGKKHVVKGSLKLEDLIQAKEDAASRIQEAESSSGDNKDGSGSNHETHDPEEARKDQKRAANRLSAFQSRQRRKIIIEDLQRTVAQLSKDNAQHSTTISQLRLQLDATLKENEYLRAQVVATRGLSIPQAVAATAAAPSSNNGPTNLPVNNNNGVTAQAPQQFPSQQLFQPQPQPLSSLNYAGSGISAAETGTSTPGSGATLPPSQSQQQQPAAMQIPMLNPEVLSLLQELAVIQHQMQQQQQQQPSNQGPPSGM